MVHIPPSEAQVEGLERELDRKEVLAELDAGDVTLFGAEVVGSMAVRVKVDSPVEAIPEGGGDERILRTKGDESTADNLESVATFDCDV